MIEIPAHLTHYSTAFKWVYHTFETHPATEALKSKLNYLLQLYTIAPEPCKLLHDLSELECWRTRTIALSENEPPVFWNPVECTFIAFQERTTREAIKTFDHMIPNPPTDIITAHINALLNNNSGKHLGGSHES